MSGCKDGDKVYIRLRKGSGKCHIKVMQCHITFEKMSHQSETLSHHFDIFGYFWHPKGVFGGFQGEIPSDQKHFVIQNAYLAKPEFSVLSY